MSKRFFVLMFLVIAAILGGLAWFHYVFLPQVIKQAITTGPQPPVTISAGLSPGLTLRQKSAGSSAPSISARATR